MAQQLRTLAHDSNDITPEIAEAEAAPALSAIRAGCRRLLRDSAEADACFAGFIVASGNEHRPCFAEVLVADRPSSFLLQVIDRMPQRQVVEMVQRVLPNLERQFQAHERVQ